jgi:hypothetical protein
MRDCENQSRYCIGKGSGRRVTATSFVESAPNELVSRRGGVFHQRKDVLGLSRMICIVKPDDLP